jgi:hypothetical protein
MPPIPVGFPEKSVSPSPWRPVEEIDHRKRYEPQKAGHDEDVTRFLLTMSRRVDYGKGLKKVWKGTSSSVSMPVDSTRAACTAIVAASTILRASLPILRSTPAASPGEMRLDSSRVDPYQLHL